MPASAAAMAGLCQRLAVSLAAGVDVRRVWRTEAERLAGPGRSAAASVADAVARGESITASVAKAGSWFPPLFVAMTEVGDLTGSIAEVYKRLAEHYQRSVSVSREVRKRLAWPLTQLAIALAVVALLIALGGLLKDGRGAPIDFLGLGLVGTPGVATFLVGVAMAGCAVVAAWRWLARNPLLADALRGAATRLPVVGALLRSLALERIAWALHLMLNVELDLRRVAPLALRLAGNTRFGRHAERAAATIGRGEPLSVALGATGEFPAEFLHHLVVAETSGTIAESMAHLAERYRAEADTALARLSAAFTALVMMGVAGVIVALIFRLFGFYVGVLNDAVKGV